jgi:hypothetical protein
MNRPPLAAQETDRIPSPEAGRKAGFLLSFRQREGPQ